MLETLPASFWVFSLVRALIPARLPLPDSPYIERVWRGRSDGGGPFLSVAAGHLELVVTRLADFTMVTLRGPETRATTIECPPDGEWAAIRFRLGVHMPSLPTHLLLDHRDVNLPVSADGSFELQGLSVAAAGPGECGTLRRPARSVRRDRAGRRGCGSDTRRRTTAHDPIGSSGTSGAPRV